MTQPDNHPRTFLQLKLAVKIVYDMTIYCKKSIFWPILAHFGLNCELIMQNNSSIMINVGPDPPSNFNIFEIRLKICF